MSLFSRIQGAAQGLIAGFKNGGNVEKALKTTETVIASYLNIVRDKNTNRLPNLIFIDSFLIGFLFRYSALYLTHSGINEQFLVDRGVIQVVSKSLDIQPESFIAILNNMTIEEKKRFKSGSDLANKTFEGYLNYDKNCMVKICNHLNLTYMISQAGNE